MQATDGKKRIAVITGAGSGMGRAFVTALDRQQKFDEIWVIGRRLDRLESLRDEVSAPVCPLSLDLAKDECLDTYARRLKESNVRVAVLVNAAGFGRFGAYTDISLEDQQAMIDLNARALMSMTYLTLPYMEQGGCIYEMGSLSSFQPVPYINVYGATKAFVLSFSRALNAELKRETPNRHIRVMAVCPGWVRTPFFDRAVTDDTVSYYNRWFEPAEVIERALYDMKRGRDVSVCGWTVRGQVFVTKMLPHRWVMDIWCRQQKK